MDKGQEKNQVETMIQNFQRYQKEPLKILFSLFAGNGWKMVKTFLLIIIKESPVWVIPIVTANIIDVATRPSSHHYSEILWNVAVILVFLFQNLFSSYLQAREYSSVIREIEMNLRMAMIEKLQSLTIEFHKENQSGRILSKVMRDVENIEVMLFHSVSVFMNIVLDTTIAVAIIASKSWMVLLFFVVVAPVAIVAVRVFRKPIGQRNSRFRQGMEETQAAVAEMVELIPVTRAHGLEELEVDRMNSRFQNIRQTGFGLDKINTLFGATSWVIFQTVCIICLAFDGTLAFRGLITVGEVVLFQTYFSQIVGQISELMRMYPEVTKGLESIKSIGEILAAEEVEENHAIIPLGILKGKVSFQNLSFSYADSSKKVLDNFSLEVKPGESIAFVGGSGVGKSTVLNLLIGFYEPTEGKILIDGINMKNLDRKEFRSQIAVVPQNTILFSGTIRENITYGIRDVSDERVWETLREVGIDDLVSAMPQGLETSLGEHGGNLSGGQRQRISIARALLRKPKIIIFDEATSALDTISEKKVQQATDSMRRQCTTFMVAHRLSTIQNADRICVMEKGKIVEMGSYTELMEKKGAFYYLKKMQE
ncbi:MAG: ABC transporter ATP-binding protein [Lachnospiraceae bacterium]|nr:ABC transporter ATP-binding protein [Lachnospiraceae bacterium]